MNHYRTLFVNAAVLVAGMVWFGNANSAAATSTLKCRPADQTSASIIAQLRQWVSTQDTATISLRDSVIHLPVVGPATITVVTDETICGKVIRAYTRFPTPLAYTPVNLYVIKIGSVGFVGYDPDKKGGEFTAVHIFNPQYVRIGGFVG